jgi:IS30 family transposase
MPSDQELLTSIDAKLGALLALTLDEYLRSTGLARPKARNVDKLLSDVGLSAQQIAKLLGKTDRAVQKQLQKETKKKARKPRTSSAD